MNTVNPKLEALMLPHGLYPLLKKYVHDNSSLLKHSTNTKSE